MAQFPSTSTPTAHSSNGTGAPHSSSTSSNQPVKTRATGPPVTNPKPQLKSGKPPPPPPPIQQAKDAGKSSEQQTASSGEANSNHINAENSAHGVDACASCFDHSTNAKGPEEKSGPAIEEAQVVAIASSQQTMAATNSPERTCEEVYDRPYSKNLANEMTSSVNETPKHETEPSNTHSTQSTNVTISLPRTAEDQQPTISFISPPIMTLPVGEGNQNEQQKVPPPKPPKPKFDIRNSKPIKVAAMTTNDDRNDAESTSSVPLSTTQARPSELKNVPMSGHIVDNPNNIHSFPPRETTSPVSSSSSSSPSRTSPNMTTRTTPPQDIQPAYGLDQVPTREAIENSISGDPATQLPAPGTSTNPSTNTELDSGYLTPSISRILN